MLTLYYAPGASSMAPHIALFEVGAPFEGRPLSFQRNENKTPEYLAINPLGQVPTPERVDRSKSKGMRGFFGSHRAGALYQGTTLVGPYSPNKDPGFSPWGPFRPGFLSAEVFRAGNALAWAEAQISFRSYGPTKVVP